MIDVEVLRTALDPSSMDVPKQVRNAFEKAARVKSLVTVPGGAALIWGSVLIAVYGDAPRVSTAARALRVLTRVCPTPNGRGSVVPTRRWHSQPLATPTHHRLRHGLPDGR